MKLPLASSYSAILNFDLDYFYVTGLAMYLGCIPLGGEKVLLSLLFFWWHHAFRYEVENVL